MNKARTRSVEVRRAQMFQRINVCHQAMIDDPEKQEWSLNALMKEFRITPDSAKAARLMLAENLSADDAYSRIVPKEVAEARRIKNQSKQRKGCGEMDAGMYRLAGKNLLAMAWVSA